MKKLGKPTYEWVPSAFANVLTALLCFATLPLDVYWWEQCLSGLPNWTDSLVGLGILFYLFFIKPFLIFRCIGYFLYIYVKLTSKYEEPR